MMDFTAERQRMKRKREILFNKTSISLLPLIEKIDSSERCVVTCFALNECKRISEYLVRLYDYSLLPEADIAVNEWAEGKRKMHDARPYILALHRISNIIEEKHDASLFHALAQGYSTVHTPRHAIGIAIYELSAMMKKGASDSELEKRMDSYFISLCEAENKAGEHTWAKFIRNSF